jgi:hypothetical protein
VARFEPAGNDGSNRYARPDGRTVIRGAEGRLYELYEKMYDWTVKKAVAVKLTRGIKRAATRVDKVKPHCRTMASSLFLINELRADLGERDLSSILKAIRDEVRPVIRAAETKELTRMRAENAAKIEAKRAAILADAVNSDAAGGFISRTRPVVNKLAKAGELLAIQDGRYLKFPRWQFDEHSDDGLVPGLRRVLLVMDAAPFRRAAWLVSPNPHFDGRAPIELLREGQHDRVYEEARAVTSG